MNFLQLMPQVGEVNSMSEELAKKHHNANVKFEPLIKNLGRTSVRQELIWLCERNTHKPIFMTLNGMTKGL